MSVEIRAGSVADITTYPNFLELVSDYADEARIDGLPRPSFNTESYIQLENLGMMASFGAYVDGELVGFANALVTSIPHYHDSKIATMESWFVAKEHRGSGAGLKLKQAVEQEVKKRGAAGLLISASIHSSLIEVMQRVSGYRESHRVFFKAL